MFSNIRRQLSFMAVILGAAQGKQFNATSLALGRAIVVNNCDYAVYIHNTPAMGGGFAVIDLVLSPHEQYDQPFTPLSNNDGWSIKMTRDVSLTLDNQLQFEYTWQPTVCPGVIWFDLSEVNGNPWPDDYEITAVGEGCNPRQSAYRFPTDDKHGMQTCPSDANITVTLCSDGNPYSSDAGGGSTSLSTMNSPQHSTVKTAVKAGVTTNASLYSPITTDRGGLQGSLPAVDKELLLENGD